ncbi:hypothetical protein [Undibacterium sp. Ji22W]|uniref:hypothetical protein n=1 Tax=Undibacterium sp. Ji22W TaxID=3413038 RepID=UPI003BEFD559
MKKIVLRLSAFILAATCSAAFAYPPPYYFCNKECSWEAPKGSPEYKECMTICMATWPA